MDVGHIFSQIDKIEAAFKEKYARFSALEKSGNASELCSLAECYYNAQGVDADFERARILFEKSASLGDAQAMASLADMYYKGKGVERDRDRALELALRSAEMGSPFGMNVLGLIYYEGRVVARDQMRARELFYRASELGCDAAHTNVALLFDHGLAEKKDLEKFISLLYSALEKGARRAIFLLAKSYLKGEGVEQDKDLAIRLLEAGEGLGDSSCSLELGMLRLYDWGGTSLDPRMAIGHFERAARAGQPKAYSELAWMYLDGIGTERDIKRAMEYSALAEAGGAEGLDILDSAETLIEGGLLDEKNAAELFTVLAKMYDGGEKRACSLIADAYRYGVGVDADIDKAVEYYSLAAQGFEPRAYGCLGEIYLERGDTERANEQFEKGMGLEDPTCIAYMGLHLLSCDFLEEAYECLCKGARGGSRIGHLGLGKYYERIGAVALALEHYEEARDRGCKGLEEIINKLRAEE